MIYHDGKHGIGDAYDLHGLEDAVSRTVAALRGVLDEFDSIIVTGMSGVVVGVPVSMALRKPLVILRKPDDRSNHCHERDINGYEIGERVCFLDDFTSSGATRKRCMKFCAENCATVVCEYLYREHTYREVANPKTYDQQEEL